MAPLLRLTLLGTPGIQGPEGAAAALAAQGQPLALLAILACAGERGIARDKVVGLLWPEAPADRASHRLSQLAHGVRRALGCPELIAGGSDLRLDPERIGSDLWEFVGARRDGRLERAAELYGGPFLDGFFLAGEGAGAFERWAESRRGALTREHQETLEALAVQAELRGDPQAASSWWRRLAEHEPLSSRVTMHLMTALAAAGDRARALERAQAYQQQVRTELEAEPNPAVLALARMLRREPPGAPADEATPRPAAFGVLPLVALDGSREAQELAQGLTEELTTAAAAIPGLRVAARTTLAAFRQPGADVAEAGVRLGLAAALEGSVRVGGGRVRLTVRLIDMSDGCQRWTGRFERELGEGFEAQDALVGEVLAGLRGYLEEMATG